MCRLVVLKAYSNFLIGYLFAQLRLISELFLKITSEFPILSTELWSLLGMAFCFTWYFCNLIAVVETYVDAIFSNALLIELILGQLQLKSCLLKMIAVSS